MKTIHRVITGDSRRMVELEDNSIDLLVTSPPYWQLKDYGSRNEIGFNDSYEEYINNLNLESQKEIKEQSRMTKEEWNAYFTGHWKFSGVKQEDHIAMFPL